jgi:hypothetical protein
MASLATRVSDLATRIATEFKTVKSKIAGNNSGDLSGLTTTVKTSILAAINELVTSIAGKQNSLGFTPENSSNKGAANGYAGLDAGGKVPAAQLPSYVDDVLEYADFASFPATGATGIIYIDLATNLQYRWGGSAYVGMNAALALGETSGTAYRGDRGKTAYDHSQATGNPHNTTFGDLGSKPTTIAGFGITDAYTKTELGDPDTNFVTTFDAALA